MADTSKTRENIKTAFAAEAKAVFRLKAYANKAEEEGYAQLARLFRAVREAEAVHARRHLKNLKLIGHTEENLKYAFEMESNISGNAYKEFIPQAIEDGDKAAEIAFSQARDVEDYHAALYKKALDHFANEEEVAYYVCNICGYIAENEIPDKCPVCNSKSEVFYKVV